MDYSNLFQLVLILSKGCNLRCKYCCYNPSKDYSSIKLENVKKAIEHYLKGRYTMLKRNKKTNFEIVFLGGEPLLQYNKIKEIIEYINNKKLKVSYKLTTNGTLLNNKIISLIKDNRINLTISIDGPKKYHDNARVFEDGSGSWKIIEKNIKELIRQEIRFGMHITYDPDNNNLSDTVKYLLKFNTNLSIYPLYENINDTNIKLVIYQLNKFKETYIKNFKKNHNMPYIFLFDNILRYIFELRNKTNKKYYCGVGNNVIAIDVDGQIYPCPMYAGYKINPFGNLDKVNWKKSEFFNNLITKNNKSYSACEHCPAKDICSLAICPAKNARYQKNSLIPLKGYCLFIREQKKICVELFEELKKEKKFIERIKNADPKNHIC